MTINYGPVCTCGSQWPSYTYYPCPVHGMYRYVSPPTTTFTTWTSVTSVCKGRHCAHDDKCNRYVTRNGV